MQCVFYLELWRWAFWLALVVPIYYGAGLCVHLLELGVESRFFTSRQAMYYAVSIKASPSEPESARVQACGWVQGGSATQCLPGLSPAALKQTVALVHKGPVHLSLDHC